MAWPYSFPLLTILCVGVSHKKKIFLHQPFNTISDSLSYALNTSPTTSMAPTWQSLDAG